MYKITLIKLMIVLVIVAILAAITLPACESLVKHQSTTTTSIINKD